MKYLLLLIHADEKDYAKLSPAENERLIERYAAVGNEMREAEVYLASDRLRPVATATTVRKQGGRIVLTDGPFAETKEQFGGYFLVDVESLDEALAWAKKIPAVEHGCVEVRPVWEHDMQTDGPCAKPTETQAANRGSRS
jgi:hypothetical protein